MSACASTTEVEGSETDYSGSIRIVASKYGSQECYHHTCDYEAAYHINRLLKTGHYVIVT